MSEVYGRSLGGASSETMARGQNPNFSRAKHGERERAAHEDTPHRDRDAAFSLREANRWREVSSPVILHPPFLRSCARAVWQVSSWCGRRERHAGADSTVKVITNGLELLHPAEEGPPPPGRRLQLGGAGLRRRRRLHLRAGLPTLHRACASLDRRSPRPPAAACFGNGLAGYMNEVLRCLWHVLN